MRSFLLSASAVLFSITAARADTFSFNVSGSGISASGTLTGSADSKTAGAFDITSATGQLNGSALSLYLPSGTASQPQSVGFPGVPDGGYSYDNVVYTSAVALDGSGLLFSTGNNHANFYYNGGYQYTNDYMAGGLPITFTLTDLTTTASTPEPSSLVLLGTGLLGVLFLFCRRLV